MINLQFKTKPFIRLLLALGIALSFVGCSMMFGQMLQSQVSPDQTMMLHGNMASGDMSHSNHTAPMADGCCDVADMANMQVVKAVPSQKDLVSSLPFLVLLSSLTYFFFITQRVSKHQYQDPPPPLRLSLLDLKTSFIL